MTSLADCDAVLFSDNDSVACYAKERSYKLATQRGIAVVAPDRFAVEFAIAVPKRFSHKCYPLAFSTNDRGILWLLRGVLS